MTTPEGTTGPDGAQVVTSPWDRAAYRVPARVPVERAARLAGGSLAAGLLADQLFYGQAPGINALIWTGVVLSLAWLARPRGATIDHLDLWLPFLGLAFAAFMALRADPALLLFDALATLALTSASAAALAGVHVTRRSFPKVMWLATEAIAGLGAAARHLLPVLPVAARTLGSGSRSQIGAVARGVLLAAPVVVIVALLFAASDAVFQRLAGDLLGGGIDLGDLPARLALALGAAWLVGGLLVFAATHQPGRGDAARATSVSNFPRLGVTEASVMLLALDVLFLVFGILQAAYLFGGRDTLEASGLTYSDYARRGFFELVAVAVVAGSIVVLLEAVVATRTRLYRVLALLLLAGIVVALASALVRLTLYQQAYGWTELRFYVLTTIVWLAIAVGSAAIGVVFGRSRWFLHALVISGLVVALGVNFVAPQAFVAEQNLARALHPELVAPDGFSGLDAGYLSSLGDDAVPAVVAALPALSVQDAAYIRTLLLRRLPQAEEDARSRSWPSSNLARREALEALRVSRDASLPVK